MDVIAGLDMMVQRGQWEKAIETAEQQVRDMTWRAVTTFSYVVLLCVTMSEVVFRSLCDFCM